MRLTMEECWTKKSLNGKRHSKPAPHHRAGRFDHLHKAALEELEKQKEELSLNIAAPELEKPRLTREYMEHWFSQFRYGDPNDREFRKRLIDSSSRGIRL